MNIQSRTPVSRRTVARTAAWSVPVVLVATAAPAFAASGGGTCTQQGAAPVTADPDGIVRSLVFPGGLTATISYAKTGLRSTGKHTPPILTNLSPFDGETGHQFTTDYDPKWSYVRLHHPKGMQFNDTLTMTINLSQKVTNFGLTVTDIDGATGSWIDQVSVGSDLFNVTAQGTNAVGKGTPVDPFLPNLDPKASGDVGNIDDATGDVSVVWPGSLQTFQITYVAADHGNPSNTSNIGQMVGIGKFTYDNCL